MIENGWKSEIYRGFIYGYCLAPFIGEQALALCLLAAFLYWVGGNVHKAYRRYLLPIIISILSIAHYGSFIYLIPLIPMIGVFSIGYGIPSFVGGYEDEGSGLGSFIYYGLGGDRYNYEFMAPLATFFVHFILALLFMLSNCIYILTNWSAYLFSTIACAICVAAIAKEF